MKKRRHRAIKKAEFYMKVSDDRKYWESIFDSIGAKGIKENKNSPHNVYIF